MSSESASTISSSTDNEDYIANLLGVHALTWVGGWTPEQCRHACKCSHDAGYSVIEIPIFDSFQIDIVDTIKVLKEYDLKPTASLGLNFQQDINNENPDIVNEGLQVLRHALSVVQQLGANYMGGVIYSALGKYTKPCTPKARANVVSSLKILAKEAHVMGITLGLEPVNRYETNLLNTVEQAVELIQEIGESNIMVHLDTYHMNIEEYDLESPILKYSKYNGYVHVGASHRGGLGVPVATVCGDNNKNNSNADDSNGNSNGNIDFDQFFGALSKIKYKGIITFESFSSDIVDGTLTKTLCIWRNLWTNNMDMATRSRKYIQDKIEQAQQRQRETKKIERNMNT